MQDKQLIDLKSKLPVNPGILGKETYFNSAVLIPLISIENSLHFLFEKRAANIRQGGEVCFPGGEFDKILDNSFEETSLRETCEELGISKESIDLIGPLDILIGPMGVTVDPFLAKLNITDLAEIHFDKNEVEQIFTIPVEFFHYNKPEIYSLKMEVHPSYLNEKGELIELLPVKELQLPERYAEPWKVRKQRVLVYKTKYGPIWGITAELINEVIKKLFY